MRLFAALPLSGEAVERLAKLRLRLSAPGDGLRWSEPEQWHVTLQFYGEVDEARAGCLGLELEKVGAELGREGAGVELAISELGMFAAKGILLAVVEASPSLMQLQQEVVRASERCGMLPESRAFRPHVTLARSKGKAGFKSLERMRSPALPGFGPAVRWWAQEASLLESVLRPQGAEYVVRQRVKLA